MGMLPGSAREAGANFRKNIADEFGAMLNRGQQLYMAPINAGVGVTQGVANFARGAVNGMPEMRAAVAARQPHQMSVVDLAGGPGGSAFAQRLAGIANAAAAKNAGAKAQGPQGAPSFGEMVHAWAAANGGKISLNEMTHLADIDQRTNKQFRPPSAPDVAGQQALEFGNKLYGSQLEQSKSNPKEYMKNALAYLDFVKDIARSRPDDPMAAYYAQSGQQP